MLLLLDFHDLPKHISSLKSKTSLVRKQNQLVQIDGTKTLKFPSTKLMKWNSPCTIKSPIRVYLLDSFGLRISDIAEELRRRRIEQEVAGSGWVNAEKAQAGGSIGFLVELVELVLFEANKFILDLEMHHHLHLNQEMKE